MHFPVSQNTSSNLEKKSFKIPKNMFFTKKNKMMKYKNILNSFLQMNSFIVNYRNDQVFQQLT